MERQAIETFKKLGFTNYEARILYALLRLKEADVKTLTRYAGVPRTKAYDVLRNLVKRGYVAEIQTRPVRYTIIDANILLDKLLEEKRKELDRLEKELTALKHVLPALIEESREGENYIVRVGAPEDFIKLVSERIKHPTVVGYTRESEKYLRGLGDEDYPSPIDFILTPTELYLPLNPLGTPQREYIIIVFTNPYIMEMMRLWVTEVLAAEGK